MEHPSDFGKPWCQELLGSDIELLQSDRRHSIPLRAMQSNSMFSETLFTPSTVRAWVFFRRRASITDATTSLPYPHEYCLLLSLGDGVDGIRGRAHGGFNALLIDQITGMCASSTIELESSLSTANLNVDYKQPVQTPCIVLCRAHVTDIGGRKMKIKGMIEDGQGSVLAVGMALYIIGRAKKL